jgi:hypothetical protein
MDVFAAFLAHIVNMLHKLSDLMKPWLSGWVYACHFSLRCIILFHRSIIIVFFKVFMDVFISVDVYFI